MMKLIGKLGDSRLLIVGCAGIVLGVLPDQSATAQTILRVHGEDGKTLLQGADGESWNTAFKFLQDAFAEAGTIQDSVQIWVAGDNDADGIIYYPDEGGSPTAIPSCNGGSDGRCYSFHLINNVEIYGGFTSNHTDLSHRDPDEYKTVLSGDINQSGTLATFSYHVVTVRGTTPINDSARLDGFTIEHGNANDGISNNASNPLRDYGGGIWIQDHPGPIGHTPVIRGCHVQFCKAYDGGGGIYCGTMANPQIRNCRVETCEVIGDRYSGDPLQDRASGSGGGIFVQNSMVLLNAEIIDNIATDSGAGIHVHNNLNLNSDPELGREVGTVIVSCEISDNRYSSNGGGIAIFGDLIPMSGGAVTTVSIQNSLVARNSADNFPQSTDGTRRGGGIHACGVHLGVTNCTIVFNHCERTGGGINYVACPSGLLASTLEEEGACAGGRAIVDNCIVRGNTTEELFKDNTHPQLWGISPQRMQACYNDIENLQSHRTENGDVDCNECLFCPDPSDPENDTNFDDDPDFVNVSTGDFRLNCGSPCINTGIVLETLKDDFDVDENGCTLDYTPDFLLNDRLYSVSFDIGAMENMTNVSHECVADIDRDGIVNVNDLLILFGDWGPCPKGQSVCAADLNLDGQINVNDLLLQIANWG